MSSESPLFLRPLDKMNDGSVHQAYLNGQSPAATAQVHLYRRTVRIGDFVGAAALTQTIDLFTDITAAALKRGGQSGDFPADSWINVGMGPYVRKIIDFSGGAVATCTAEVGAVADTDGFVTASNVFTGSGGDLIFTPAAALYDRFPVVALAPTLRLVTTVGNVADLTAGALEVVIPYMFFPRDLD